MNIKLHKYLLLYVAVVLLNSCVDAQKNMSGGDNADTKEETSPTFIYHSYMCFGKDCEEAIITGIAKDSIHLYKDIVGIQTDSIIKTNSEKILDPFIHPGQPHQKTRKINDLGITRVLAYVYI